MRLRQLAGELMRRGFPAKPIAVASNDVVWQAGAAAAAAAAAAAGSTDIAKAATKGKTSRAAISKAQRAAVAASTSSSSNDAAAAVTGAGDACVVVVLQGSVKATWARPALPAGSSDVSSTATANAAASSSSSSDSAAAAPAAPAATTAPAAAAAAPAERHQTLTAGEHCFCGDLSLLGAPEDSSQPPQQRSGAVRVIAQEDGTRVLVIPAADFKQFITRDHMQALRKFLF